MYAFLMSNISEKKNFYFSFTFQRKTVLWKYYNTMVKYMLKTIVLRIIGPK